MNIMRRGRQTVQTDYLPGRHFWGRAAGHRINILGAMLAIAFVTSFAQSVKVEAMEPSYLGRSLSSWLADFNNPTSPNAERMAAEAVRHIGSPALPYLVERLSESNNIAYLKILKKWQKTQTNSAPPGVPPPSPRWEGFCGLDALGVVAMPALPDLQKLLEEKPPDPAVLYLALRTGPAGILLLNVCFTSNSPELRLEAKVLRDMLTENSEVLYPSNPEAPDAPSFRRRMFELNLKLTRAAALEYSQTHPHAGSPDRPEPSQSPVSQVSDK